MRIDPETPAGGPDSLQALNHEAYEIRGSLIKHESDLQERVSTVHPAYRKSAINLIHYLALRHQDIRTLQDELAALGLSSLGRTEAHVMSTLNAVLVALHHMAGRKIEAQAPSEFPGFREGRSLLAAHTEALLGPAPKHRSVRIMVTMSSEAADDYQLVRDLVSHGMNCMRINCAHDTPEIWGRMVNHLERARQELGLPCRLLMDIAGPKLRTGAIEPGPRVVVWHPKRDSFGRVKEPARIWLAPARRATLFPPMRTRHCQYQPNGSQRSDPENAFTSKMHAGNDEFSKWSVAARPGDGLDAARPHTLLRERYCCATTRASTQGAKRR